MHYTTIYFCLIFHDPLRWYAMTSGSIFPTILWCSLIPCVVCSVIHIRLMGFGISQDGWISTEVLGNQMWWL